MKKLYAIVFLLGMGLMATAQMTAMDFNRNDCNGNPHHLFADLDAGNAVILEYFMTNCSPCVVAGTKLEAMKADLLAQFPGKVKSYSIGFTNAYSCVNVANWVSSNSFTSYPMDSGSASVAYYGGFGMPTVVILGGGSAHTVLGSPYIGFTTSDTITMAADIRNFLSAATAMTSPNTVGDVALFPQPASDQVQLSMTLPTAGSLRITLMDLSGREIKALFAAEQGEGPFNHVIDTKSLVAGLYLLKIQQGSQVLTKRLVVTH